MELQVEDYRIEFGKEPKKGQGGLLKRRRDGCDSRFSIVENVERARGVFRLELITPMRGKDRHILLEDALCRFRQDGLPGAGQCALERMFGSWHEIPPFFQRHTLWFPATVFTWRSLLYIPYMHYAKNSCKVGMGWLKYTFFSEVTGW